MSELVVVAAKLFIGCMAFIGAIWLGSWLGDKFKRAK